MDNGVYVIVDAFIAEENRELDAVTFILVSIKENEKDVEGLLAKAVDGKVCDGQLLLGEEEAKRLGFDIGRFYFHFTNENTVVYGIQEWSKQAFEKYNRIVDLFETKTNLH